MQLATSTAVTPDAVVPAPAHSTAASLPQLPLPLPPHDAPSSLAHSAVYTLVHTSA